MIIASEMLLILRSEIALLVMCYVKYLRLFNSRFSYGQLIRISLWKMKMMKRTHTVFAFLHKIYCWYVPCAQWHHSRGRGCNCPPS